MGAEPTDEVRSPPGFSTDNEVDWLSAFAHHTLRVSAIEFVDLFDDRVGVDKDSICVDIADLLLSLFVKGLLSFNVSNDLS